METGVGLSPELLAEMFPFHVVVDSSFEILQLGPKLQEIFDRASHNHVGMSMDQVFDVTFPITFEWDWQKLILLSKSSIQVVVKKKIRGASESIELSGKFVLSGASAGQTTPPTRGLFLFQIQLESVSKLHRQGLKVDDLSPYFPQLDYLITSEFESY